MADDPDLQAEIAHSLVLLRDKLGIRATGLRTAMPKARRQLPRKVRKSAQILADAEPLLEHPKLRQTLDRASLTAAAGVLSAHLNDIDAADRRKGWWLGMLGGLAFNMLAFAALLIAVLVWRGYL
ncbi:hypothetical protein [Sedimentitalea nanhaiensis]|uniref:Uncharacterized protein n=1 Tax=Sedimentitalea nanhaiensis TaxID=999627 RepID=A0A1I7E8A9_9RHOB|nr:hypothetical protein [Sedimentitalea nanhaiensis]SFU20161.1 hypothetical protein SAMN05216236_1502 [Sedimentitalea nanhaiensis]